MNQLTHFMEETHTHKADIGRESGERRGRELFTYFISLLSLLIWNRGKHGYIYTTMVLKTGPDRPVQLEIDALSGQVLWKNRKIRKISQKLETDGSTKKTVNRTGWTGFGLVPLILKLHRFGHFFPLSLTLAYLSLSLSIFFFWSHESPLPHAACPLLPHAGDSRCFPLPSCRSLPLGHSHFVCLDLSFSVSVSPHAGFFHSHSHGISLSLSWSWIFVIVISFGSNGYL